MRILIDSVRRFWTHSIRRQLILGIALVHAVLMTIFVFDMVARQRQFLHEQAIGQATSLAETLAANSTAWVLANDISGIEEVIHSQSQYPGLHYAMLISPQGEVLGHTQRRHTGRFVVDAVSRRLLDSPAQVYRLIETPQLIDIAAPILANGQLIGWARVALNQDENIAGLQVITRDGVFYTLLAIGVGVLFAYFMGKSLTGALRHFVEVSGSIRRGEPYHRVTLQRHDELGQLAYNFNAMLDALDQARAGLSQSEERYELAMRGANDGLWDWDKINDRVYYSPRWKAMLGYAENEIGDSIDEWFSRLHPDDRQAAKTVLKSHLAGNTHMFEHTHRILHHDGTYRWWLGRGMVVRNSAGKPVRLAGTATDVTQRKLTEERLFEEKERALVTLNSIGDAVITTDKRGVVNYLNPVAETLTGWPTPEAQGRPLDEVFRIVNEQTGEPGRNPVSVCIREGQVAGLANDNLLIGREGKKLAIEDSAAPIRDRRGTIIGVVVVFHDVTQARDLAQQMSYQATHDSLTGLVNRNAFEHRLAELLKSAHDRGKLHTLLYIDLDQFKLVNDTCGHVAGDELLRQLSFILQEKIRESDVLARLGGDEFGLLLAACPLDQGRRIAEDIRQAIKEFRFSWQEKTFEVGASIGVVQIDQYAENSADLLSDADVACYAAKDLGRNRIHVFEPDDEDLQLRRGEMQWVSRINAALAEDRLELYSQAIQSTRAGASAENHFEVLLRMRDTDGRLIPPSAFIPAAERYNLMPAVDRWVVQNVCVCIRQHLQHTPSTRLHTVAINLSGNTLGDDGFLDFIKNQLRETAVPPGMVCLEITETAAIANLARANHFIREMKKIGCRFALDDFGSGLSSFAYLKNLPVDYLKIDGSFIKDMTHDPIDFAMVRSINEVGHVMGIQTIAEFVEDERTLQQLKSIGVDYVQGYGIGRPIPIREALQVQGRCAAP